MISSGNNGTDRLSGELEKPAISVGFIPLTDCAPLVVAKENGYFDKYGLEVNLSKETSWANIRDKVAIGVLDAAQMLAPMPLALSLGLGPIQRSVITALTLDLNGNAITVSNDLYTRMCEADPDAMSARPTSAHALKKVIEANAAAGCEPLRFAMVFPLSTHNYQLRYWMAAAGIDPDRDVRLEVVPPPQMVSQLRAGRIDGYCVGEPWGQLAVKEGLGHVVITSYEVWNNGPEKVLGVTEEWAAQHPNTHQALIMALLEACLWLDQPENRREVVDMLARGVYVNAPAEVVKMSLTGSIRYARNQFPQTVPDFNVFHRYAANFPWRSHAMWFMTQMLRWGQWDEAADLREVAAAVYRPDVYRAAAGALGLTSPGVDYKREGTHDANWPLRQSEQPLELGADVFLDGRHFDPADPIAYLESDSVHNGVVPWAELRRLNARWSNELQQHDLAAERLPGVGAL